MFSEQESADYHEPTLAEINAVIPRRVYLDAPGTLVVSLVFFLGGLAWIAASYFHFTTKTHHADLLRTEGRDAAARITRRLSGRGGTYVYYTFDVEGVSRWGEAKEPSRTRSSVGQQLPIRFLPADPSINYPNGWNWFDPWDGVLYLFPVFFTILGFVCTLLLHRDLRLARTGWVVEGKVTGCAPRKSKFSLYYEFHTQDGRRFEGSNDYSDEYDVDSSIQIIYLRSNPKRNDRYPMSTFRSVE
jgi:hypothetical protein